MQEECSILVLRIAKLTSAKVNLAEYKSCISAVKEFRYLRTVIVTAAVYWGLSSKLAHLTLTFQHWAGVRPYTSSFEFAESCVFDKQSLLPGLCHLDIVAYARSSLSRSYGCNLSSSFNIIHSTP